MRFSWPGGPLAAVFACAACPGCSAAELDAEVIVVGAGYAGLGAARRLARAGVDVLILEARDRVGGRTWAKDFMGSPLDFGGAWITGGRKNPMYEVQREYGLKPSKTLNQHPILNQWNASFVRIPESQYWRHTEKPYWKSWQQMKLKLGRSYYEAMMLGGALARFSDEFHFNATAMHISELDWAGRLVDMDSLTTRAWQTDGWEFEDAVQFWPETGFGGPSGMAQTIAVAEGLQIRFETVVTSVSQVIVGTCPAVTLTTESGQTFTARRVVSTLPLGVLKAGDVIFNPPLSDAKQLAIQRLGFGVCNKLFMAFEEENFASAPWASGCIGGNTTNCFTWCAEHEIADERPACRETCTEKCGESGTQMEYFAVAGTSQPSWFMNLQAHPRHGAIPVVGSWFCFSEAIEFERNSTLSLQRHLEVLRNLYPGLGDPVATDFSAWHQDRFAKGVYSYPAVGSPITDYDSLAAPEGDVYFAGEATTRAWGSVPGAFISGERAADEIIAARSSEGTCALSSQSQDTDSSSPQDAGNVSLEEEVSDNMSLIQGAGGSTSLDTEASGALATNTRALAWWCVSIFMLSGLGV